jgi:triacylglycerol lipase
MTVMLADYDAARNCLLAAYAEAMFSPDSPQILDPPLDLRAMPDWELIGHFVAADAVFGFQQLGLGQQVYYGFLAKSRNNPVDYVAVTRGTLNALELIEDLEGFLVPMSQIGQVEQGFYSIYRSMRYYKVGFTVSGMLAAQAIANVIPDGCRVNFIGHSLGSAITTYLMTDTARIPNRKFTVAGALFASPRTGNAAYVKDVDAVVGPTNYRVYNYIRDIVPHVPPSLPLGLGFQDLPQTTWITPIKAQAVIRNEVLCNHHAESYAAMLDFSTVSAFGGCILGRT